MKYITEKERKFMILALDPGAQPGEAENAWMMLLKSLRTKQIRGYDIIDQKVQVQVVRVDLQRRQLDFRVTGKRK